jgi:hypothetical protein
MTKWNLGVLLTLALAFGTALTGLYIKAEAMNRKMNVIMLAIFGPEGTKYEQMDRNWAPHTAYSDSTVVEESAADSVARCPRQGEKSPDRQSHIISEGI